MLTSIFWGRKGPADYIMTEVTVSYHDIRHGGLPPLLMISVVIFLVSLFIGLEEVTNYFVL